MKAFHSNWTAPYLINSSTYEMKDYEILMTILSALKWREKNGSINIDRKSRNSLMQALVMTAKRVAQMIDEEDRIKEIENNYESKQFFDELYDEFLRLSQIALEKQSINSSRLFNRILQYVHEKYSTDISLTDLSNEYNVSKGYVNKLFKDNVDTTFKDYLNRFRVNVAKSMLKDDINIKLTDIASAVGFTNAVTFNRVFKRYEGIAPSEYKNKLLGEGD